MTTQIRVRGGHKRSEASTVNDTPRRQAPATCKHLCEVCLSNRDRPAAVLRGECRFNRTRYILKLSPTPTGGPRTRPVIQTSARLNVLPSASLVNFVQYRAACRLPVHSALGMRRLAPRLRAKLNTRLREHSGFGHFQVLMARFPFFLLVEQLHCSCKLQ